jgi:hypothetical protein
VPDLLTTRAQVLKLSGFAVLSANDIQKALDVLSRRNSIEGAVICHSFSVVEQLQIRQHLQVVRPGLAVMLMRSAEDNSPKRFIQRARMFFQHPSVEVYRQAAA